MIKTLLLRRLTHATLLTAMLLTCAVVTPKAASAGVIVSFSEVGPDVVATISGSLGAMTASNGGSVPYTAAVRGGLLASSFNQVVFGNSTPVGTSSFAFQQTSGSVLGWGTTLMSLGINANSTSISGLGGSGGLGFSVSPVQVLLYRPTTYVNGTAITGTNTWTNTTLAALGLDRPGTYIYGKTGGSETFTVIIPTAGGGGGGAAVPEPSSLAVASILGLVGWHRTRRKRQQTASV